jgi:hypothetical protein
MIFFHLNYHTRQNSHGEQLAIEGMNSSGKLHYVQRTIGTRPTFMLALLFCQIGLEPSLDLGAL